MRNLDRFWRAPGYLSKGRGSLRNPREGRKGLLKKVTKPPRNGRNTGLSSASRRGNSGERVREREKVEFAFPIRKPTTRRWQPLSPLSSRERGSGRREKGAGERNRVKIRPNLRLERKQFSAAKKNQAERRRYIRIPSSKDPPASKRDVPTIIRGKRTEKSEPTEGVR